MRADLSRPAPYMVRGLCCATLLAAGLSVAGLVDSAWAQAKKTKRVDTQKISGKVSAIEKKGKAAKVTVEKEDGDKLEISVTPKMDFAINGKGDASFLQHPRTMVSAEAFMSGENLISREFTVYVGPNRPATNVTPDPKAKDVYKICGEITEGDKDSVTLDLGGEFGVKKVSFESGGILVVNVVSSDAAHAPEGAVVDVEGTEKGGKFLPSKVTITLAEPMKADDVFGGPDKSKASSKAASKTPKKAAGKSKDDNPSGENVGDPADPFGLKKKPAGKMDKSK